MSFEQELKYYYYLGYEHASEEFPVANWFTKYYQKVAYMQGRVDYECNADFEIKHINTWEDIFEELYNRIK